VKNAETYSRVIHLSIRGEGRQPREMPRPARLGAANALRECLGGGYQGTLRNSRLGVWIESALSAARTWARPMLAQIPHVLLAAHVGTIMGVETNAMQFYPAASAPEQVVHPGLYQRRRWIYPAFAGSGSDIGSKKRAGCCPNRWSRWAGSDAGRVMPTVGRTCPNSQTRPGTPGHFPANTSLDG